MTILLHLTIKFIENGALVYVESILCVVDNIRVLSTVHCCGAIYGHPVIFLGSASLLHMPCHMHYLHSWTEDLESVKALMDH